MLTSKVIVTDDYLKYLREVKLREGQRVVQLWHACGAFKRFGLDAPSRLSEAEERATHSQYTDVCVSSEYVRQFYAQAFGIDESCVKALGVPRTDKLLDKAEIERARREFFVRNPDLKGKKIYAYLPTFRESGGKRYDFDPGIDWGKLNRELNADEVFAVSRHPVEKKPFFEGTYDNVKDITKTPTSLLLVAADVVITDYSSVIFDACLMDKPIVFYCPDHNSYERDFYLDFENDLPGKIIMNGNELTGTIRHALNDEEFTEKLTIFRKKELDACDGKSTGRIAGLIEGYVKG